MLDLAVSWVAWWRPRDPRAETGWGLRWRQTICGGKEKAPESGLFPAIPGLFLVGLIDLCSTYSATPVSTDQLREISGAKAEDAAPRESRIRRSWNRLSHDAQHDVVSRYEAGATSTALAAEYGVAKSTILGILRASNTVVRRQRLQPEVVADAAHLYHSGLSLSQVAKRLDVNQETMRAAILAAGTKVRPPTGG